jgi:hypothetical protein
MFFFVDESGNTGSHLFDPNQPNLFYGVLGCRSNLDIVAAPMINRLRTQLGVARLHASELGAGRLIPVAEAFTRFAARKDVRFSFYTVVKADHAVISFFDQIFDSGVNEAVPYHSYWTPLRYMLLLKVAHLFDDDLRRRAWAARLEQGRDRCEEQLRSVCRDLQARVSQLPDARSRELIDGALAWAQARPEALSYGASNRESALQISPNLIGFQQVLQGIANVSARTGRPVRSITVDRQNEFNTAQGFLAEIYRRLRGTEVQMPPGMPNFDWSYMPEQPPQFRASGDSFGLEMVDIYLWTMKRAVEGRDLPPQLHEMLYRQRTRGRTDEVSLAGIDRRWRFLLTLPDPSPEAAERATELLLEAENRRLGALSEIE